MARSRSRERERHRSRSGNRYGDRDVKRERSSSKREDADHRHRRSYKEENKEDTYSPKLDKRVKNEHIYRKHEEKASVPSHRNDSSAMASKSEPPFKEKEKPNFEPSGLLAAETNQVNGIVLKYTVPPESRFPTLSWRLFVFKPDADNPSEMKSTSLFSITHSHLPETICLHRKEYYLIGKEQLVADIDAHHPTISKQHAVIQFRHKDDDVL
ncbi:hypothetical protein BEWA_027210 [Theileria equi strain WA]|uniref:FHA domain-containing protein n=1 Tax=Theileria equi strain WA TaxID=1537102 RepID=L0AWA3_THEEQ|nr:hypothetical protein BEWA_027210 [Theileria equi strain WA]AFZ79872.1 hypothetical protein BEWA_027210 [Theileria equi strain WA]|eukprot:XP_004829538.1 hypothetical protein BEWA_027210 [Theileria equi strain WA]